MTFQGRAGGDHEFGGLFWGDQSYSLGFSGRDVAISATSNRYACPSSDAFTPAQAALMIERLVDRHNGTPYRAGDTAEEYPYLTCDDTGFLPYGQPTPGGVPASDWVCGGTTTRQWAGLAHLAGQSLVPAVPPPPMSGAGLWFTSQDSQYYVVFGGVADSGPIGLLAVVPAADITPASLPTYTLVGNQVVCGYNVCELGNVVAVWVQVDGDAVTAAVCLDRAVVSDTAFGSPFFWGTVYFDVSRPGDPAVQFVVADNCALPDGSFGNSDGAGCH